MASGIVDALMTELLRIPERGVSVTTESRLAICQPCQVGSLAMQACEFLRSGE